MIIAIIQPCFVPWMGYFEQIGVADIFLYLDDVQYTKKDWRNTNQLKTPNGIKNIYVPVQNPHRDALINQVLISYNENWQSNLMNKITEWYKKAPYFSEIINIIASVINNKCEKLVDLNYHLNNEILQYIGIDTPIFFSSAIPKNSQDKNERIIELCKHFKGVDILYDGKSAQNFIDTELFRRNGIEVIFQDYQHTPYKQLWGEFAPYMSIIDLLMNCGKNAKSIIFSSPLPEQLKNKMKL